MLNYEAHVDSFAKKAHIASDLIIGDPNRIPKPWLSYTVPTYKRADLLQETLHSILRQKEADVEWEIVVVDNDAGGENETERLIRELSSDRILYYRNRENLMVDGNVNRCIKLARGEWVAMVHADDLLMSDHLPVMTGYIRELENKEKKTLAYISPRYVEFSDISLVDLDRQNILFRKYKGMSAAERRVIKKTPIVRYRPIDALLTGTSVFLPSNGTIMNKKVMMETGGFNDEFGICTDLVKPYSLAKDYRVYKTLRPFGYYRIGHDNESRGAKAIHDIAVGCHNLTEYIYSRNLISRIWGDIARDERFKTVIKYMLRYSRYGNLGLTENDFDDIHICRTGLSRKIREILFKLVMRVYSKDSEVFLRFIRSHMMATIKILKKELPKSSKLVVYGAGGIGCIAVEYIRKHLKKIDLVGFAVTLRAGNPYEEMNLPVYTIDEFEKHKYDWYFLVSVLPATQPEILKILKEREFNNVYYIV